MAKIRNIIFDMGGVLIDLDREAYIEAFREIGYPQADELLNPYRQKGIFMQLEKGMITDEEFYRHVRSEAHGEPTDSMIQNALNRFLVSLPVYKLEMLLDLRKRYKVFMLSNTNSVMMPHIKAAYFRQQGLQFEDYFDHAFLSFEMGMLKPDEEIYLKMLADGNMKPDESLFLDDGQANVEAAAKLGIKTYHVKPHEDYRHIFDEL